MCRNMGYYFSKGIFRPYIFRMSKLRPQGYLYLPWHLASLGADDACSNNIRATPISGPHGASGRPVEEARRRRKS